MNPARWANSRTVLGRRAGTVDLFCGGRSKCRSHRTGTGEGSLCAGQTLNKVIHKLWEEGKVDSMSETAALLQSTIFTVSTEL